MEHCLMLYYNTPHISWVSQLRLRVVPVKLRLVVMSKYHILPLAGHSYEYRTLLRVMTHFWWPMVNKEVAQSAKSCAHFQLVNSCSRKAQNMIHTIEPDTPFNMVYLYFF